MTDVVSPEKRSRMMRGIRARNTKPELTVRRWLYAQGYRYRLHWHGVLGHPDIVLPSRKIAIFVHGCFWHRHEGCKLSYMPKSNIERWNAKFEENVMRDKVVRQQLEQLGWRVVIVWECSVRANTFAAPLAAELTDAMQCPAS